MSVKVVAKLVSFTPNAPPQTNFCKDCKHIRKGFPSSLSKCSKFGKVDMVDGYIIYSYASIAREYECKGEHFEKKDNPIREFILKFNKQYETPETLQE
jgi:hypothetical protein